MTKYYELHVFFSRYDGYSVAVKIDTNKDLTDDEVIEFARDNNEFTEDGDALHVDYVAECDESVYILLCNK